MAETLCDTLIKWIQSLNVEKSSKTAGELSDGVAISQALAQIAPEYFTTNWCSKIKTDCGNNWRLKVSNLKKVVEAITEYYHDELNLAVLQNARPDVNKIGESANKTELGKLLQLVLGCAVNCQRKQEYITKIMHMEETVQQCIMQAIQLLETATKGPGPLSMLTLDIMDATQVQKLNSDLEVAVADKEFYAQKCHELEAQVQCLQNEKTATQLENERLQQQLMETSDSSTEKYNQTRMIDLRRQVETLKEDLFKTETAKDDYRLKVIEYEKELSVLQAQNDELQAAADRAVTLKDEVDALTETAEKVQSMEATIASYKKKLEEYADLKRQITTLEDKNNDYFLQNLAYEEEMKKHTALKSQLEFYKKQLIELQTKYDAEIQTIDRMTFESKKLDAQLAAANREKQVLAAERDALREANDELRFNQTTTNVGNDVAGEMAGPELKNRLRELERENRLLKVKANETTPIDCQTLLEDSIQQQEQLRGQLRASNQKIIELEAKLDETLVFKQKYATAQEAITLKDQELQILKEQTRKNTEKARETIRAMQLGQSNEDVMRASLNVMKESEARLITSAYFHLAEVRHRESADAKLALLSTGQGGTFLSRQRQAMPRKAYK